MTYTWWTDAAVAGKYVVCPRWPTLRSRPSRLSRATGRDRSRAVDPIRAANVAIVSPGVAVTAAINRSPSAAISLGARRLLDV